MRTLITGGAGFVGSHLCERFLARGPRGRCASTTSSPASSPTSSTCAATTASRSSATTSRIRIEIDGAVDNILHFASPASPVDYLRHPDPDAQGRLARHAQHAGPGQGEEGPLPAGQHQRSLRRSRATSAARGILGPRQPHRHARRLRRGQALRRGDDHGLPPLPRRRTRTSSASSTPMASACGSTTAGSCRTSWARRCAASR